MKIGPIDYEIILEDNPTAPGVDDEGNEKEVKVFGKVDFRNSRITIDNLLAPQMQMQCLWHEIMHVVFEQLGLEDPGEGGIDALAYKIMEICQVNFPSMAPLFPATETPRPTITYASPAPVGEHSLYTSRHADTD